MTKFDSSQVESLFAAMVRKPDPLRSLYEDGIIYRFVNVYRLAGTTALLQMGEVKDNLRDAKIAGYKCHGTSGYSTLRLWLRDGTVVNTDIVHTYERPKGK